MKLVVISPESDEPREHAVVAALFAAGLERYHVRKPRWSREKLVTWLQAIAPGHRSRMVLHQHHELAEAIGLLGIHCKDSSTRSELDLAQTPGFMSRSCHDLTTLDAAFGRFDAVFFSPVFPSISKPGYRPTVALTAVAERLSETSSKIGEISGLIADISARYPVADLTVEDQEIEEVIRGIYTDQARRMSTPVSQGVGNPDLEVKQLS